MKRTYKLTVDENEININIICIADIHKLNEN